MRTHHCIYHTTFYLSVLSYFTINFWFYLQAVLINSKRLEVTAKSQSTSESTTATAATTAKSAAKPELKQQKLSFGAAPKKDTASAEASVSSQGGPVAKVLSVVCDVDRPGIGGEGRLITVELDSLYLVGCYVPNSGEGLKRLDYRLTEWDPFLRQYLKDLHAKKPVILAGDLNVAHLDLDIYNHEAKHIVKQAGLTPQERASFGTMLGEGYVDALRFLYPGTIVLTSSLPFYSRLFYFCC